MKKKDIREALRQTGMSVMTLENMIDTMPSDSELEAGIRDTLARLRYACKLLRPIRKLD